MSLAFVRGSLAALALAVTPCCPALAEHASPVMVITHFDLIPKGNNLLEGKALLEKFVLDSRADPGVTSFTLITWTPTPNHFQVLEIYASQDAFNRHVAAAHTIAFRTAMQPFVGAPIDERVYTGSSVGH